MWILNILILWLNFHFIQSDWIEIPQISPPKSSNRIATPSTFIESPKNIQTQDKTESHGSIESYEEYLSSRSFEDSRSQREYKPRPWNTRRSSPFSSNIGSDSFDSSNYYRWRNASVTKVKGSPSIAESIDYTIVSPESTPLQDDAGLGFPKNIIISSKTSLIPGSEILIKNSLKKKPTMIDSKLDEDSMSENKPQLHYESTEQYPTLNQWNQDKLDLQTYEEESDELPKPNFDDRIDDDAEHVEDYTEENYEYEDNPINSDEVQIDLNQSAHQTKSAQISAPSWNNFSFAGFLRYLKQIQDRFLLKTARTVEDKVLLLENLHEKIANNIMTRIDTLFSHKRSKRSFWSEKDEHEEYGTEKHKDGIDFPSAESALLSIAFLTFAVFLIKLVLQVITALKYKYAAFGPYPGTAGAVVGNIIKTQRNARRMSMNDDDIEKTAQVMKAIKE